MLAMQSLLYITSQPDVQSLFVPPHHLEINRMFLDYSFLLKNIYLKRFQNPVRHFQILKIPKTDLRVSSDHP